MYTTLRHGTPAPRRTDDASNLLMLGAVVILLVLAVIFLYARKRHGESKDNHGTPFGHHDSHRLEPGDYYSGFNRQRGARWPWAGRYTRAMLGPSRFRPGRRGAGALPRGAGPDPRPAVPMPLRLSPSPPLFAAGPQPAGH